MELLFQGSKKVRTAGVAALTGAGEGLSARVDDEAAREVGGACDRLPGAGASFKGGCGEDENEDIDMGRGRGRIASCATVVWSLDAAVGAAL